MWQALSCIYSLPPFPLLEALYETLGFEPNEIFVDNMNNNLTSLASLNIAIIATDYTELSIVTLLNIQETYSSVTNISQPY